MSIGATTFVKLEKVMMYIKFFLAENEDDNDFKRRVIETVVDVEKLFQGINANPLLNVIMKDLLDKKKLDFEFKFPLVPVSN